MGLFKKKSKEIYEEADNIKYVPYICDGEKWLRMYYEEEVELIKKEAYEQGFKDGATSCNMDKERKIIPPSGKFLPRTTRDGEIFLLEY